MSKHQEFREFVLNHEFDQFAKIEDGRAALHLWRDEYEALQSAMRGSGGSATKDSEEKPPHAGLEVMGNIQINEGGDLYTYYRALLMTFNTNEDIRRAIAAEQCTFGFKE